MPALKILAFNDVTSAPAWIRTGTSEDPDPGAGLPARPHSDHEDPRGMVPRNK
jgi:hypothetical protein